MNQVWENMCMRNRSGVSPLVAMVLLIAIVVAAAGLVGNWMESLTGTQTDVVENESEQFHTCNDMHLQMLDVSAAQTQVNVTVMNAGFQRIPAVNVVVLGSGVVLNQSTLTNLSSSAHASTRITVSGGTPEQVVAIPTDCPQMTVEEQLQ